MPSQGGVEPVVAPEELAAADERRRAEDAAFDGLLGLPLETLLVLRRPGGREQRARVEPELLEQRADHLRLRDLAILREVRVVHRAHEARRPGLVAAEERDPCGEEAIAREPGRRAERQPAGGADAGEIAPHVAPLHRVDVEGRVVPALGAEDRSEQERLPGERHVCRLCGCLHPHGGRIGVRARELEPELDRGHPAVATRPAPAIQGIRTAVSRAAWSWWWGRGWSSSPGWWSGIACSSCSCCWWRSCWWWSSSW